MSLADVALGLAAADHKPARKSTYLSPLRRLHAHCASPDPVDVRAVVEEVAQPLRDARLVPAPEASAAAALAGVAASKTNCYTLAARLVGELSVGPARTKLGWGGYAGELAAWRIAHQPDPARAGWYLPRRPSGVDAYRDFSVGRVLSMAERFSPPLTADLALATIQRSLLPGSVHVVYALKAYSCQQAIYMGTTLGRLFGNASLGAFVELSSGRGVGHGKYDAERVNRARITPLGRIGGEPCT